MRQYGERIRYRRPESSRRGLGLDGGSGVVHSAGVEYRHHLHVRDSHGRLVGLLPRRREQNGLDREYPTGSPLFHRYCYIRALAGIAMYLDSPFVTCTAMLLLVKYCRVVLVDNRFINSMSFKLVFLSKTF